MHPNIAMVGYIFMGLFIGYFALCAICLILGFIEALGAVLIYRLAEKLELEDKLVYETFSQYEGWGHYWSNAEENWARF